MVRSVKAKSIVEYLVHNGVITKEHLRWFGVEIKRGYLVSYGDVCMHEVLAMGELTRTRTSKRGVKYTRLLSVDGDWKTIYPTPEDARRAEVLRLSDIDEKLLKKWLKDRMIFNH